VSENIFCKKLNKEAPALTYTPYPGALGQRIRENISAPAWEAWLGHQTMLINEYRLNLTDKASRQFLETEMEKFLFADGSEKPAGFVDPNE
jgi:Fe-S cluster biosynthesis and repair protein YggX